MSEILFIAIDPYILALVENLQQMVEPTIRLESDYTSGIKRIFDTRPAIVFLQHKIDDVTCDKLANQVKMLLDGEPVPMVLMSDESGMSYSVVATYEACLDLCLPMDELSWQVQQLLRPLPDIAWKGFPDPAAPLPGEPSCAATLEISVPAGIVDFSLPFPWQEGAAGKAGAAAPPAEYETLAALEGNAVAAEAGSLSSPLPTRPRPATRRGPPRSWSTSLRSASKANLLPLSSTNPVSGKSPRPNPPQPRRARPRS